MRRLILAASGALFVCGVFVNQWGCVGDSSEPMPDASNDQTTLPDNLTPDTGTPDSGGDAGDAATGACTLSKPFNAPVAISAVDVFPDQELARLSHDALTIYFSAGGVLQVATRNTVMMTFGVPMALLSTDGGVFNAVAPTVTPDALTLYTGSTTISYATRTSPMMKFGPLAPVATLADPTNIGQPYVQDPTDIWFVSHTDIDGGPGAGGTDIYHATIVSAGVTSNVVHVPELATPNNEFQPTVSPDGLTIYFARNTDPIDGGPSVPYSIYTATRTSTSMPFSTPVPVNEVNTLGASQRPSFISANGCVLWLESTVASDAGTYEIYNATKPL